MREGKGLGGSYGSVEAPGKEPAPNGGGIRRLGVVGTLVWDRIVHRDPGRAPVEEWGGAAYALGAAAAALPDGWEIVPILKVGKDLSEAAFRYLRGLPGVVVEESVMVVPEANNRVELLYENEDRRTERLSGGVPPWTWTELSPHLATLDALYVNFIAGFEMELDTAMSVRSSFAGPIYSDLHSLFLGVSQTGIRVPQLLPSWGKWLRCFDAVQVNEDEFELLGRSYGDPWKLAADVVGPDLKLIAVTLGPEGAAYVASSSFDPDPMAWPDLRKRVATPAPAVSRRIPVRDRPGRGDPTGCGDVWGATFFCRLLAGDGLEVAMTRANASAVRNLACRGAGGLHFHLKGQLSPPEGRV
jgi:sugar/nucleoside kinase (ribokinase family)